MLDPAIKEFQGEYRFLSNFWPVPIKYQGLVYPSVEHAYQAAKCANQEDRQIILAMTPGKAKRCGRTVAMIENWDRKKLAVMFYLVLQKFQGSLRLDLIRTGTQELIEGNYWGDTYWGVCSGKGFNHLGQILMVVRDLVKSD